MECHTSLSPFGKGKTELKTVFSELDTVIVWRRPCNCSLVMWVLMCAKQCYWKEWIPWITLGVPLVRLWTQLCIHVSRAVAEGSSSCTGYLHVGFCIGQSKRSHIDSLPFSSTNSWLHTVTKSQPAQNVQVLKEKPCRTHSHSLSESVASKAPAEFWTFVQYLWMMHGDLLLSNQNHRYTPVIHCHLLYDLPHCIYASGIYSVLKRFHWFLKAAFQM